MNPGDMIIVNDYLNSAVRVQSKPSGCWTREGFDPWRFKDTGFIIARDIPPGGKAGIVFFALGHDGMGWCFASSAGKHTIIPSR
jgi:hypothetical protein